MRILLDNEYFCCDNGCGETDIDEQDLSVCCGTGVFIWDKNRGVVVTDPDNIDAGVTP